MMYLWEVVSDNGDEEVRDMITGINLADALVKCYTRIPRLENLDLTKLTITRVKRI